MAVSFKSNKTTFSLRGFANQLLSTWTTPSTLSWSEDAIWRGDRLLANASLANGDRHYALDHLGSPRAITGPSSTLLGIQTFAVFGGGGTANGGALQFTGHERDAAFVGNGSVNLPDYFHARYYDPARGRFLSVDPKPRSRLAIPQTWNRYSYALNNPLKYVDPDGREITIAVNRNRNGAIDVNVRLTVEVFREAGPRTRASEFQSALQGAANILGGTFKTAGSNTAKISTTIDAIFTSGGTDKSRHQVSILNEPATALNANLADFKGNSALISMVTPKWIAHEFAHWMGLPNTPEIDPRSDEPSPNAGNLMDESDSTAEELTYSDWLGIMRAYREHELNKDIRRHPE